MKGRVLVIDDEPEIRRNLMIGLTQEGYSVVACPDGISAIHELTRAREKGVGYDFLVTDIFMPDIDGMKILKVIKTQFPALPVLVITGFGDEALRFTALSEENTGFLDKPFEISELVEALEQLAPGTSTLEAPASREAESTMAESVSAYLTLRIPDPDRSLDVYNQLRQLEGIESCEAVRGDVDLILVAQAPSPKAVEELFQRVRAVKGVEVVSLAPVERPKIDRDVNEFIDIYQKVVKTSSRDVAMKQRGTTSYIIVDIDKDAIQQIFTTVFFIDEVVLCDVIEGGTKLVGMITGGAVGRTPRIIEKISQVDGVLRVREAKVIKLVDD